MEFQLESKSNPEEMYELAKRLFPIHRSITGNGVLETLRILNEIVPLKIINIKSGTKVFDWVIPQEWKLNCAYIKDEYGNVVADVKNSNLHIIGYSDKFKGTISLEELKNHLYSLPERPNAIPYITSYYKKIWGMCLKHNDLVNLKNDRLYEVNIDTEFFDGCIRIGEILIKGKSKKEILISCNTCHPSLANNEISGMIVAINLAKYISEKGNNFYTYRFVFLPETIGSISYLSKNLKKLKNKVIAGFQLTCIGDEGNFCYLKSRSGDTISDKSAVHILKHTENNFNVYDFSERGSDERQYCAPGIDLPIGSLTRSMYALYPEYHTSDDNLDFISGNGLFGSFKKMILILEAIEKNKIYKSKILCEPHFSKYNLYPSTSTINSINEVKKLINTWTYCDGKTSLLEIAEKNKCGIFNLYSIINRLKENGII